MDTITVPQGRFALARYPVRKAETLRAWDAADEYLLAHLATEEVLEPDRVVLVVNDDSGVLGVALAGSRPTSFGDSYLSRRATEENLLRNGLEADAVSWLSPLQALPERIDVVLMKVPKSLSLLEDQLHRIAPRLGADSTVVAAAMSKHIHTSTLELFERLVGPTRTSLAVKKARLILVEPDPTLDPGPTPWPTTYSLPDGQVITSHAGVFSPERLDIGTRFLLDHLPGSDEPMRVVDLGCGNGVVGTVVALRNPNADLTFVDDSYLAVASAEATYRANLGAARAAEFIVGNGLLDLSGGAAIEPGTVDLVLNNPPFHVNHAIGDQVAWQMFSDARVALCPGGELWVVGNRHLAYHAKLKRLFGNCDVVASNSKFVLLRSVQA